MSQPSCIAAAGEILVEFVSHRRNCGLMQISDYSGPYPSGAPAIFVDQAARMGAPAQMFGAVGADGFGQSVLQRLIDDGVDVGGVKVIEDRTTGTAFVSYYDDGNRDFIFHLAGTAADAFDAPRLADPADTIFHVSASALGSAAMRGPIMQTVRAVADAGGWITCDPNARPELMGDPAVAEAIKEVMARSYCLLPSTSDLAYLFPDTSEEDAIARMLDANAEVIALKRGAGGATIVGHGARFDFAGHSVTEIDPTGAGDCFGGTFVALLAQAVPLQEAGQQANAAGAIAVTRRGPMEGNSSPAEITAFLNQTAQQVETA